jgi:hypothetical protein
MPNTKRRPIKMLNSLKVCGNCTNFDVDQYCKKDLGPIPERFRDGVCHNSTDFSPRERMEIFPVEELISEHIDSMGWILDYCLEKGINSKTQECPGGCGNKYVHGADDSTYDYIPNGLDIIRWVSEVMYNIWDHDEMVSTNHIIKRHPLPPIQDCVSKGIGVKILRLAFEIGYDYDDIVEAGYYDLEIKINFYNLRTKLEQDYMNGEWVTEDDNTFVAVYLGSVMSLTPSGKYYTPFACSNVDEDEVFMDEVFMEELERRAEEHHMFLFNGEGDPTDLYIGMNIEHFNSKGEEEEEEASFCGLCGNEIDDEHHIKIGKMEHKVCGECYDRFSHAW